MPKTNPSNFPIGVFDSGLGGLTVVKEMMRALPYEDIVYFGDTARVPYGTKSKESIIRFSIENVSILLRHKVKMVVVACNSSSSYALKVLQKSYSLPIVGVIEPGSQLAAAMTRNKRVGVVATQATINSQAYTKMIHHFDPTVFVVGQPCPLFVPLVEEGWADKKVTFDVAREYLKIIQLKKVDTLILGCTHYPLLKATIARVVGPKVLLIDSAKAVTQRVKEILAKTGKLRTIPHKPRHTFLISDRPQHFKALAKQFLGYDIEHVRKCDYV